MNEGVRLLIVGVGVIGRAHAQRVQVMAGCTLAGIAGPSAAGAAFAAELGVPHWNGIDAALEVGKLVAVQGSALFHKPAAYFSEAPWRTQRGGGPILTDMVHEVDYLRLLAGDIVEVQAFASNARRGFEVEDTAAISLRFASGALGSFVLSDVAASTRTWEQTSGENEACVRDTTEACYLVTGERGSLAVPTLRLQTAVGDPSWFEPMAVRTLATPQADPLQRQLAHFCAVVRREATPLVSARDATRTLQAKLAIAEAATSDRAVRCGAPPP